ncbi:DNA-binding protein [Sulfolobus sp. SCGC AB-777_L09]|nr:DNA-binding protein [Sulfolobus sp. SCGC AB-777_L09]
MHELHLRYCRRALEYLKGAEKALNENLYNVSGVLSQISAELAIKATIAFLGYSFPETHEIRRLLGFLSTIVMKEEIEEFVRQRRGELILLEDARVRGQYMSYDLTKEDAEICLNTAKEIINLIRKVWGDKWCSD